MKKICRPVLMAVCFVCVLGLTACNRENGNTTTTTAADAETTTVAPVTFPAPELSKIHEAVKNAYGENYLPDMSLDAENIAIMKTIPADLYSECIVEIPGLSAYADEFMAFKAAEGKAADLEKALNEYKNYLINDSFQYANNKIRVQACEVVRHGDYMFFILLGREFSDDIIAQGEEAMLSEAKEQVKIGVDVINGFFSAD